MNHTWSWLIYDRGWAIYIHIWNVFYHVWSILDRIWSILDIGPYMLTYLVHVLSTPPANPICAGYKSTCASERKCIMRGQLQNAKSGEAISQGPAGCHLILVAANPL